jgi:malonyl-CoA O-methyltransferase
MRFARVATRLSVARPGLWRLLRRPVRAQFDRLAPSWEGRRGPEMLVALGAALEQLDRPPERVLELGTGTGKGARLVARLFPQAQVEAVDISPGMVEEARRLLPAELEGRLRVAVADATALPFETGAFDLVVLLNMIPFFDELARVTAPGGSAVIAFSFGESTPIYVPAETLRDRLAAVGFESLEEIEAGGGSALIARRTV